ncbi:unnamed protein product, partial [Allacma fusca]
VGRVYPALLSAVSRKAVRARGHTGRSWPLVDVPISGWAFGCLGELN